MSESVRRKRIQITKQMIELENSLSESETLLSKERIQIVEMKSMELLADLKNGVLSAVDVLHAFQAKSLDVTKRINCITEFIPEAESWAKECDLVPVEERGPLHGIPVSIKDCVNIKGVDTTLGLTKLTFNPATSNALIIEVLLENGAVPFCKTNIPQTMYSIGCSNPVFGTTSHPYDMTRSCGGSSGGEGALIAAGGSVLGLGTDIGGSIRLPASLSGCVGLKPSASRLSSIGVRKINAGLKGVESAIGPMGRDVEIVAECMRAISGDKMSKRDSSVVPVPWNELTMTSKRTLKFGYFDSIDMFPTTPGVKRAIHVAKKALEASGHIVIPFKLDMFEMAVTAFHILGSDGGKNLSNFFINGEIIEPLMLKGIKQSTTRSYKKPLERYIKRKTSKLSSKFMFSSKFTQTSEYWKSLHERQEKIDELVKRFRENDIDLLLSPPFPMPAPTMETISNFLCGVMYTFPFNYLDFPSGTLPVTHETEEDQKMLQNYPEDDSLLKMAKESTQGGVGLPLGVMITGLPFEEELVCKGMMELQEALKASSQQ